MNDNQVGRNTVVQNTMILPYHKEVKLGSNNIGNDAVIGGAASIAKNIDFPDQINSGITVIGCSAEIPRGTVIESGCYLDGRTSKTQLRNLKKLKRGRSLFSDETEEKQE